MGIGAHRDLYATDPLTEHGPDWLGRDVNCASIVRREHRFAVATDLRNACIAVSDHRLITSQQFSGTVA